MALLTTQRVELMDKKEFVNIMLNEYIKVFMVHMSFLSLRSKITIYTAWKITITLLLVEKSIILAEYADFVNVFLKESIKVLSERTGINKHAIELEDDKQPPYRPIYSLGSIELKTLKTYININLANGFIRSLKFLTGIPILFVYKPNGSLWLCVDYRGLNNLTIKNQCSIPLILESLDWLGQAKHFF